MGRAPRPRQPAAAAGRHADVVVPDQQPSVHHRRRRPPEFFGADPDRPPDVYVPMHANLLLEAREYFPRDLPGPELRLGRAHGATASRHD